MTSLAVLIAVNLAAWLVLGLAVRRTHLDARAEIEREVGEFVA